MRATVATALGPLKGFVGRGLAMVSRLRGRAARV